MVRWGFLFLKFHASLGKLSTLSADWCYFRITSFRGGLLVTMGPIILGRFSRNLIGRQMSVWYETDWCIRTSPAPGCGCYFVRLHRAVFCWADWCQFIDLAWTRAVPFCTVLTFHGVTPAVTRGPLETLPRNCFSQIHTSYFWFIRRVPPALCTELRPCD